MEGWVRRAGGGKSVLNRVGREIFPKKKHFSNNFRRREE